jgi:hypothetical protein
MPLTVFIAEPVTGQHAADPQTRAAREAIAELLSAFGVRCHSAGQHADPAVIGRAGADNPVWRERDEMMIAAADLVVVLHPRPATGLGVVVELARRYGVPVIVAHSGSSITPMVSGAGVGTEIILGDQTHLDVLELILRWGPRMDARRLDLEHVLRPRWRREREAVARSLEELVDQGAARLRPGISVARFRALLASDFLWGGATRLELHALEALTAGPGLPALTWQERRALRQTAVNLHWSADLEREVELEGRREMQARRDLEVSAPRVNLRERDRPTSVWFWERVRRELG